MFYLPGKKICFFPLELGTDLRDLDLAAMRRQAARHPGSAIYVAIGEPGPDTPCFRLEGNRFVKVSFQELMIQKNSSVATALERFEKAVTTANSLQFWYAAGRWHTAFARSLPDENGLVEIEDVSDVKPVIRRVPVTQMAKTITERPDGMEDVEFHTRESWTQMIFMSTKKEPQSI